MFSIKIRMGSSETLGGRGHNAREGVYEILVCREELLSLYIPYPQITQNGVEESLFFH